MTTKLTKAQLEAIRQEFKLTLDVPDLIQVSYSGGKASEALLHMILDGDIVPPARFVVTCANPGMENPLTHVHTMAMEERCQARGIPFLRAHVDLYRGILEAKKNGATRFDFPAFFTKNRETGKIGKLKQRCTRWCKSEPMDRLIRDYMAEHMGIPRKSTHLGYKTVHKWIGFTHDEWTRIKQLDRIPKYVLMDYPFVNLKITIGDVMAYYERKNYAIPPRSVCNGCFANSAAHFKMLHDNHYDTAWKQAWTLDEAIRDLSQFDLHDECYIYGACIPLLELAAMGFPELRSPEQQCHSGHCFL